MIKKTIIFSIVIATFAIIPHVLFKAHKLEGFNFPSQKIYAHKGGQPENSIKGIINLIERGHYNFEVDLFLDNDSSEVFLSHDPLKKEQHYDSLTELFKELKNRGLEKCYFWLDFKNLNEINSKKIGEKLNQIVVEFGLRDRLFVESREIKALKKLSNFNIKTVYWINPYHLSRLFYLRNYKNIYDIITSKVIAISMPYEKFNDRVKSFFGHIPVLLFTVNDEKTREVFSRQENIKIIIKDFK